jgi:NitT/TauT family transport system substrate-binding protein
VFEPRVRGAAARRLSSRLSHQADGGVTIGRLRIQPHGRLQEWVADEKGYFKDEGLDYEFVSSYAMSQTWSASVQSTETAAPEVKRGAFEDMEEGRSCQVSSACHWAVNMASASDHGRMWGHAYSVTPSGIYVPPESPIRDAKDLANVPVGVGYHSGSHFSALQALQAALEPSAITFDFIGLPLDRLTAMLDRKVSAANVFGPTLYILEQQGFRKVVDTTFMIGFLFDDVDVEDVARYFRALRRAQRDIDLEPERYKHYFLDELPEKFRALADVRTFGPGERLVFEEYTREMYEQTHRWMERWQLFPDGNSGNADYELAVVGR